MLLIFFPKNLLLLILVYFFNPPMSLNLKILVISSMQLYFFVTLLQVLQSLVCFFYSISMSTLDKFYWYVLNSLTLCFVFSILLLSLPRQKFLISIILFYYFLLRISIFSFKRILNYLLKHFCNGCFKILVMDVSGSGDEEASWVKLLVVPYLWQEGSLGWKESTFHGCLLSTGLMKDHPDHGH